MDDEIAWALASACGLCDVSNPDSIYRRDVICTIEYSEILLLDPPDDEILWVYPCPGVRPRQLHATDDALYCVGQGDGGITIGGHSGTATMDPLTLEILSVNPAPE